MTSSNAVIAIDEFSSCGSSLAKQLAAKLKYAYVDSGTMYRAITLYFLNNAIDLQNLTLVAEQLKSARMVLLTVADQNKVFLNDKDVSEEIRKRYVAENVSKGSPIPSIRAALVKQQSLMSATHNIIIDGRDIGTKVFPYAKVKLFMTAAPKIRAKKRPAELCLTDPAITFDEVFQNLSQRDHNDTTRSECHRQY